MITFTLDTNCIIDLDEERPAAPQVRQLAVAHAEGVANVALVAVSASERQRGDQHMASYHAFVERVERVGLNHLLVIKGMAYWGISFWDHALWADEAMEAREREIHTTLFPRLPFQWSDFAESKGIDVHDTNALRGKRWRNAFCDRQMYWAHDHAKRDVFVTSDGNFSRLADTPLFPQAQILTPSAAVQLLPEGLS